MVGRGGFGVVYRAHHLGFNEKVAVKCLRIPQTLRGPARDEFEQNFLAEGRLLHQLSRSTAGIVQALDVGAVVSPNKIWTPFIVLEWLDGQSLDVNFAERLAAGQGGRSLKAAVELLDSAARALALAHEQGIAHRDIKPANLFLAEVGGRKTLKVLDFGIAKVMTESESFSKAFEETGASLQAFTARYGSPEQFSRRYGATGPWSDVFSLALVLIEAVVGHSALEGVDTAQLFIAAADTTRRPTLRAHGVELGDAVEGVLTRALAVDPKERYANVGQFWDALWAVLAESGRRRAVSAGFARQRREPERPLPGFQPRLGDARRRSSDVRARQRDRIDGQYAAPCRPVSPEPAAAEQFRLAALRGRGCALVDFFGGAHAVARSLPDVHRAGRQLGQRERRDERRAERFARNQRVQHVERFARDQRVQRERVQHARQVGARLCRLAGAGCTGRSRFGGRRLARQIQRAAS